jgi:ketosteroid isomerase-like protein
MEMKQVSDLSPEEKVIYDISEKWSKAIVSNDADAIGSFMAEEWVMISERGVSTKEHFLSFVRSGQLTHSSMEMAELNRISLYGDTAIIAARVTNTAQFAGQTFEANEWTSDVFIRQNGAWKYVMTHITPAAA